MATRNAPIVGVFSDRTMAERAIDALKDAGFSNDEIRYSGHTAGGGFFENLKSWFTGEEAGTTGDVLKDLEKLGVPENQANYYAREYAAGHPIVAVKSPGHEADAVSILRSNGSINYEMAAGTAGAAFNQPPIVGKEQEFIQRTTTDIPSAQGISETSMGVRQGIDATRQDVIRETQVPPQPRQTGMAGRDIGVTDQEAQALRLREEQLRVEKERVQKGEVRVRKEIVEEQQSIDVPVRHEEVIIERHPIVEPRPTDIPVGRDEVIQVPLSEEQVTISKQPVETEEITLKKREVEEQKRASGTVRKEEARIEPIGDISIQERGDQDLGRPERNP